MLSSSLRRARTTSTSSARRAREGGKRWCRLLSLVRILAIALVAFFVDAASSAPTPMTRVTRLAVSLDSLRGELSPPGVGAALANPASGYRWSGQTRRTAVNRDAVELELDDELDDDDRDHHASVADESASRTRGNPGRGSLGRARWAEEALVTSRFSAGPGIPRGPPRPAV